MFGLLSTVFEQSRGTVERRWTFGFLTNRYTKAILAIMARPREFDEEQALERATALFWEQGYERTSVDELLGAMELQKGSFYNAFGSKRALYLRCLARYRDSLDRQGPFGEVLQAIGEGPPSIRKAMARQIDGLLAGDCTCGCFVANASAEHRGTATDVLDVTRPGVEAAAEALEQAIVEAQEAGTMPPRVDAKHLATLFMTMGYGTQLLASAGVPRDQLLASMDAMFAMMQSPDARE